MDFVDKAMSAQKDAFVVAVKLENPLVRLSTKNEFQ